MSKKIIVLSSLFSMLFAFSAYAENTTQLIIEKRITPDRKTGFILYSDLKPLQNLKNTSETKFVSKPISVSLDSLKVKDKFYSLYEDKNSYSSVVVVRNSEGIEIKRISVGRNAVKIVKLAKNQHLFVLCGGYFGSVWEIDPQINHVIKKYTTTWNPTDIALSPDDKYFYVAGGKLQKFSTEGDVLQEYDLPPETRYFYCISPVNETTLGFGSVNKDNTQTSYILNNEGKFEPSNVPVTYMDTKEQKIEKDSFNPSKPEEVFFAYSRGNDYLYVYSMLRGKVEGIVSLDSKIDEVLMLPQMNKAMVLHRVIGQISVIDLTPNSNTQYSVIARITDERLKDPTNSMAFDDGKVYLKSDLGQEGNISADNMLRYTSPIVDIQSNKEKEEFAFSNLGGKRYFLKNSQLFFESVEETSQNYPKKIKMSNLGNTLGGMAISTDKKILYVSDYANNRILGISTITNAIISVIGAGSEPADLTLYKDRLYVLNKGENSISTIDLKTGIIIKTDKLKIESNNLNVIRIYDNEFDQIIKITLPPEPKKELMMSKAENL